ncbi:DNA-binding HEXBP [Gossypium arboreum]|uniref:DNA-binding HEXBP n=1 Tax=Gossypium arboreum TaxID=29729 RepID=A0A0B0NM58_GOSAR|nr:DNA-binding HEXBP [Gossypium arboreum]
MIEKVQKVEEAMMAKATEAIESLDPNTWGSRYFHPPDGGWETCYNCGEEGHIAVNCKSASTWKKPCFVCGSLDHGARQCSKNCFICKKCGHHHVKGCPDKYKSSSNPGMTILRMISRCGQLGHTGLSYGGSLGETKETTDNRSPSLCYKCGEGGHFAHECTTGTASSSLYYKCGGGHFARQCTTGAASSLCYKCGEGEHSIHECSSAMNNSSA